MMLHLGVIAFDYPVTASFFRRIEFSAAQLQYPTSCKYDQNGHFNMNNLGVGGMRYASKNFL
jgi:hypothetical protein